MSIRGQVWETGRPVRYSLPGLFGKYSENDATDYLTRYWDNLLVESKAKIDSLDEKLCPLSCGEENFLPLLAVITGFVGEYDITNYPIEVQRNLIDQSYSFIWRWKGSEKVLLYLLGQLGFNAVVWTGARLLAGETEVPHTIGKQGFKSFILLPIKFFRQTPEWELAESIVDLYTPAYSDDRLCYDAFFAGLSVAGDPTFDWASLSVELGIYPEKPDPEPEPEPDPEPDPEPEPEPDPDPEPEPDPDPEPEPPINIVGTAIPGRLQAEDFKESSGIQTEQTTDVGGGLNIGYINWQDWVEYDITVTQSGTYSLTFRYAAPTSRNLNVEVSVDGNSKLTATSPGTGGFQNWQDYTTTISLTEGHQTFRVDFLAAQQNINYIDFVLT
jgi:hypothetical protein